MFGPVFLVEFFFPPHQLLRVDLDLEWMFADLAGPTSQGRIFNKLMVAGVIVPKQMLPFKPGSLGQPLCLPCWVLEVVIFG